MTDKKFGMEFTFFRKGGEGETLVDPVETGFYSTKKLKSDNSF